MSGTTVGSCTHGRWPDFQEALLCPLQQGTSPGSPRPHEAAFELTQESQACTGLTAVGGGVSFPLHGPHQVASEARLAQSGWHKIIKASLRAEAGPWLSTLPCEEPGQHVPCSLWKVGLNPYLYAGEALLSLRK